MRTRRGFTLVEILLLLAVAAILVTGAFRALRPGGGAAAARAYRAELVGARVRAMTGAATAVRWEPDADAFVVRDVPDDVPWCTGPTRRTLARPRGVAVTRWLRDGVVWLPDGMGRTCGGGGVYGGRVRFEGRHEAWDVVVSSSGRLRLEAVP